MKPWQAIGCALFGLVAFVAMIVGVVFYATSGVTDTADAFFASVKADDYETAHALTSTRLQQAGTPEDLRVFTQENGITDIVETSWSNRSINNDRGSVTGTVTSEDGAKIMLSLSLVAEGERWLIDGFDFQNGGGFTTGSSTSSAPPSDASAAPQPVSDRIDPAALAIAENNVPSDFWLIDAWADGDYFLFSSKWKDRVNPATLAARYPAGNLTQAEITMLDNTSSTITIAEFDGEGRLIVEEVTRLPGREVRLLFTYENTSGEAKEWKIVDLEVDLGG